VFPDLYNSSALFGVVRRLSNWAPVPGFAFAGPGGRRWSSRLRHCPAVRCATSIRKPSWAGRRASWPRLLGSDASGGPTTCPTLITLPTGHCGFLSNCSPRFAQPPCGRRSSASQQLASYTVRANAVITETGLEGVSRYALVGGDCCDTIQAEFPSFATINESIVGLKNLTRRYSALFQVSAGLMSLSLPLPLSSCPCQHIAQTSCLAPATIGLLSEDAAQSVPRIASNLAGADKGPCRCLASSARQRSRSSGWLISFRVAFGADAIDRHPDVHGPSRRLCCREMLDW